VGIRVTLQHANFRQLPRFIDLARQLAVRQVSFLAVDVANPHAFGRTEPFSSNPALRPEELPAFERILCEVEASHADDFRSGLIAESPRKLRQLHQYFAAVCGLGPYPPVRCNAPEFSAVIGAGGAMQPCFFISGPRDQARTAVLEDTLNSDAMMELRRSIRS